MHFSTRGQQNALLALPPEHAEACVEHAQTLEEAAVLMLHRTGSYGLPWRTQGALGNLLKANQKLERLMSVWWRNPNGETPALHKDGLDDAFDAINYLGFFIWLARSGSLTGPRQGMDRLGLCEVCDMSIRWISCPTGGWWAHLEHPEDGHDAV